MTAASNAPGGPVAIEPGRPRASVVMVVYDDLRFFDEAVDSILQQDFRDLELIIVDDGGGNDTIFEALARRDPRIRLVVNPTNLGPPGAANCGIEAARADIIVRLDADDVAEPTRVGRLVAALADDPQLGLIGSWCMLIDEAGWPHGVQRPPETDLEIRWTILFHSPFFHSTVAFRRSCFEAAGRYRIDQRVSCDTYLWFDMLPLCRARNIAEPLARYRWNSRGLTVTNAKNARNRTHAIRETLWPRIGLTYTLYDDAVARDLTQFLRGYDAPSERRAAVYRVLLTVLPAFLAASQPFAREEDAESARRLAHTIVTRVSSDPPADVRDMLMIFLLCWRIDRRAAILATMGRLANALKRGGLAARKWLVASRAN